MIYVVLIPKPGKLQKLHELSGHVSPIKSLNSLKSDFLLSGGEDGLVILWNIPKGIQVVAWVPTYKTPVSIFSLAVHPTSQYFAALTMEGDIRVIKLTDEVKEKMANSEKYDEDSYTR